MLNLFQHVVTIAFFCLFCSTRLASKKIIRCACIFINIVTIIDKNMIPLAPPSQEGMGEAFLAPQGAALAPPLQEGMWEASLAPPRDVIALGVKRRLVDAHALGCLRRVRAPRGRGRRLAP
jgi:hypothetical protein